MVPPRRCLLALAIQSIALLLDGCGRVPPLSGPARRHAYQEVVDARLEGERLTLLVERVEQTTRDEFMAHRPAVLASRTRHFVVDYDLTTDGDNLRAGLRGCEDLADSVDPRGGKLVLAGQPPQVLRLPYPDGAEVYERPTRTWRVISPARRTEAQVCHPIFGRERTWIFNGGLLGLGADLRVESYAVDVFGEAFTRMRHSGGPGQVSGNGEEVVLGPETINDAGFASIYDRAGHRRDVPVGKWMGTGGAERIASGHWLILSAGLGPTAVTDFDAGTSWRCPRGDFLTWNAEQGHLVFLPRGEFTPLPAAPTTVEVARWDFRADRLAVGRLTWPDYPP